MSSSMDCQQAARRLDEYASSELDAQERAEVDRHLHGCADCRDALQELRALDARIRALPRGTTPPDFLAQVHAKLPHERLGLDQRSTAPSAWLSDHAATSGTDVAPGHFLRVAA